MRFSLSKTNHAPFAVMLRAFSRYLTGLCIVFLLPPGVKPAKPGVVVRPTGTLAQICVLASSLAEQLLQSCSNARNHTDRDTMMLGGQLSNPQPNCTKRVKSGFSGRVFALFSVSH